MRLVRIHHIDYIVRDLDRAIERYRQIFHVPLEARLEEANRHRTGGLLE